MHFVFTTLGYHPDLAGGAYRYVTEVAEGLAARGHNVHVIYPGTEPGQPRHVPELRNGVHLNRISVHRGSFIYNWLDRNQAALERLKIIRRDHYPSVLVSSHGYFASAVARSGGPIVSLFTGPWAEEYLQSGSSPGRRLLAAIMRRVEREGLKRSRSILTISRYYQEKLKEWHSGLTRPVHVIDGGVDVDQFKPPDDRAALRARLGLGEAEFLFLAVRRLEPRMGLVEMIQSFGAVASGFPKARLWIGGTGPMQNRLELEIARLNLQNSVRLLGFIAEEELADYYGAADCTLMPSLDLEGFGLSTVESLACGTPVIGSRRGATPEILDPLDSNLLYNEPADLAAKLVAILRSPGSLPPSTACRECAVTRYSWVGPVTALERVCLESEERRA